MTKKTTAPRVPAKKRPVAPPAPPPAPRPHMLDALAGWLNGLPRPARMLVAGVIAALVTGVVGVTLFGGLFQVPREQLRFGFITPDNIGTVLLIVLSLFGFFLYWVGWRVLIGFDFGDEPFSVTRAGALWVVFGVLVAVAALALSIVSTLIATGPV